jgi:hypothetical protein
MSQIMYCWRCRADVPMLEEHEWEVVAPHLFNAIQQIQKYRQEHGCSLAVARAQGVVRKHCVFTSNSPATVKRMRMLCGIIK